jgi:hypothetical protein
VDGTRADSLMPPPPHLRPITVDRIIGLDTFDAERTHFLNAEMTDPDHARRSKRPWWCPRIGRLRFRQRRRNSNSDPNPQKTQTRGPMFY